MIHRIRQILNGVKEIDEKIKYQFICVMIGSVHLLFMLFFLYCKLPVLFFYNVFVVLFYFIMTFVIARIGSNKAVFLSIFAEILIHAILATVLIGWDYGFVNYMVPLIPTSFYMAYTVPSMKKNMVSIPIICSAIVFIVFFGVNGFVTLNGPVYGNVTPEFVKHKVYLFNILVVFLFLWTVAMLFSLEIRYMQHHLEEENFSLSRMANYDALTKLLNRRSMNIQLKQVLDETENSEDDAAFCLIMTDIDDFKKVNDTYGHSFGDEVLVEVAGVLQSNVREEDRVCRWGGEEMLILLRNNMDVARSVAQRICSDMAATVIESGENKVNVTLTLGVSEYKKGESIRTMIETADQRLYRGKRSGKNCVVWN